MQKLLPQHIVHIFRDWLQHDLPYIVYGRPYCLKIPVLHTEKTSLNSPIGRLALLSIFSNVHAVGLILLQIFLWFNR